jgi:hypothetical protein
VGYGRIDRSYRSSAWQRSSHTTCQFLDLKSGKIIYGYIIFNELVIAKAPERRSTNTSEVYGVNIRRAANNNGNVTTRQGAAVNKIGKVFIPDGTADCWPTPYESV